MNAPALDDLIARAVDAYKRSDAGKWIVCEIASQIVGKYEKGATERLRAALQLSDVSTVQNYAYSWWARETFSLPQDISLHPSHFACAWPYLKHELADPRSVEEIMATAAEERWSVRELRDHFADTLGPLPVSPREDIRRRKWRDKIIQEMWSLAESLESLELREEALGHLRWLTRWLKEKGVL